MLFPRVTQPMPELTPAWVSEPCISYTPGNSNAKGAKWSDEARARLSARLIGNTHKIGKKHKTDKRWNREEPA